MENGLYYGIGFDLSYALYKNQNNIWIALSLSTGIEHEITNEKNFLSNHKRKSYRW